MFLFFKGEKVLKKEELKKTNRELLIIIPLSILISLLLLNNIISINVEEINEFTILLIELSFVIVFGGIAFIIVFMDKKTSGSLFKDGRYDYVLIRTQIAIFIASLLFVYLFLTKVVNFSTSRIPYYFYITKIIKACIISLLLVQFYNLMYSIKGFFQILLISKTYDVNTEEIQSQKDEAENKGMDDYES